MDRLAPGLIRTHITIKRNPQTHKLDRGLLKSAMLFVKQLKYWFHLLTHFPPDRVTLKYTQ